MRHRPLVSRNTQRDKLMKPTIENEKSLERYKRFTYVFIANVLPIKNKRTDGPKWREDFMK